MNFEDDAVFNQIILTDEGLTESDENIDESENTTKTKYARTTKEQFKRLFSYKETHVDFVKGKPNESQQLEWDAFIVELNNIGPPYRTSEEWKVVWTNHKHNRKRRHMPRKQSSVKIPCTQATLKSFKNTKSIEYDSNTEKATECEYGHLARRLAVDDADDLALGDDGTRMALEIDSSLAVDQDSLHLVLQNDSSCLALDDDAGHSVLVNDSSRLAMAMAPEEDCEYGLTHENDCGRLALDDAAHLALENDSYRLVQVQDSINLVLDPDLNCEKMKISYVEEEDKENFHSKVLNKLDVLIKEQQKSNENIAELIAVIKKK